mmetsp:Transcript_14744/g.40708  ORF Transcript_14744/g.40708 Transcript_14744/m.40708 type:complete len:248 (+) Transcript_14744:137-880(+)
MGPRHTGQAFREAAQEWHMDKCPQGSRATSCGLAMQTMHHGRRRRCSFPSAVASADEPSSSEENDCDKFCGGLDRTAASSGGAAGISGAVCGMSGGRGADAVAGLSSVRKASGGSVCARGTGAGATGPGSGGSAFSREACRWNLPTGTAGVASVRSPDLAVITQCSLLHCGDAAGPSRWGPTTAGCTTVREAATSPVCGFTCVMMSFSGTDPPAGCGNHRWYSSESWKKFLKEYVSTATGLQARQVR